MKTNFKSTILLMTVMLLTSSFFVSCEKDNGSDEPKTVITVTTSSISQITQTSAKSGGSMTITGNATIDGKGVCWSTSSNPTVSLSTKTADGTGSSSYTSSLIELTPSTTYYVRAYATHSEGVVYGNELTFTTGTVVLPTVTTSSITNITQTTATVGGNVTSDGGATITERGVCYSTTQNPTVDNSKVQIGSGTGTFTSNITGLTANITYYVRAYATNSVGTSYGNQVLFKTPDVPSISNNTANVTYLSVTLSGLVNANGSNTTVNFEYGTTTNYGTTIILGNTISGNADTPVSIVINNLEPNQKYYYRIVATNSFGTTKLVSDFTTTAYKIGDEYLGGIIAYIFKSDDNGYVSGETHGLIVAKSDTISVKWCLTSTSLNTLDGLNEGKNNTVMIVNNQGQSQNYAALVCRNKNGGDWFLPSIDELQKIFINKTPNMNFQSDGEYWSSSQSNSDYAKTYSLKYNMVSTSSKLSPLNVRAVRYF